MPRRRSVQQQVLTDATGNVMEGPVPVQQYVWVSRALCFIAVLIFVLAAFGVSLGSIELIPLGLAFGFASFMLP